jgi:chromosome partitioning protein
MTKVLSFVNSKGGAGKTTLVSTLGVYLHRSGKRVLFIDTDPESSLAKWFGNRVEKADMECMTLQLTRLRARLDHEAGSGQWDYILIDTPGRLEEIRPALDADLVVIPVQSGGHDLLRFTHAWSVAKQAGAKILLVPNRIKAGTRSIAGIGPTLQIITEGSTSICPVIIQDRSGHGSHALRGLTILDIELPTSSGCLEIAELAKTVEELLDDRQTNQSVA